MEMWGNCSLVHVKITASMELGSEQIPMSGEHSYNEAGPWEVGQILIAS